MMVNDVFLSSVRSLVLATQWHSVEMSSGGSHEFVSNSNG
jgi:hypothetical protein